MMVVMAGMAANLHLFATYRTCGDLSTCAVTLLAY